MCPSRSDRTKLPSLAHSCRQSVHTEKTRPVRRIDETTTKTASWYADRLTALRRETSDALATLTEAREAGRKPTARERRAALAAARALARRLEELDPDWHERRVAAGDLPETYA